jgi:hypothetical protein
MSFVLPSAMDTTCRGRDRVINSPESGYVCVNLFDNWFRSGLELGGTGLELVRIGLELV